MTMFAWCERKNMCLHCERSCSQNKKRPSNFFRRSRTCSVKTHGALLKTVDPLVHATREDISPIPGRKVCVEKTTFSHDADRYTYLNENQNKKSQGVQDYCEEYESGGVKEDRRKRRESSKKRRNNSEREDRKLSIPTLLRPSNFRIRLYQQLNVIDRVKPQNRSGFESNPRNLPAGRRNR